MVDCRSKTISSSAMVVMPVRGMYVDSMPLYVI